MRPTRKHSWKYADFVEVLHWGARLPRPPAGVLAGRLYSALTKPSLALRLACFVACVVFVVVMRWGAWLLRPPVGVLAGLLYSAFVFNVVA